MTDKDFKQYFKQATIVIDTQEKQYSHITKHLDKKGIHYERRKLLSGDYTFKIGDKDYENEIIIERKADLSELALNFCDGRERFVNEFARTKARKIIMIEYGNLSMILQGKYRSDMKPLGYYASLMSFHYRYNINVDFVNKEHAGVYIVSQFYYWLRDRMIKDGG